ncbi:hypothetical protein OQA88_2247 [Cercophora sp. LCS_1]
MVRGDTSTKASGLASATFASKAKGPAVDTKGRDSTATASTSMATAAAVNNDTGTTRYLTTIRQVDAVEMFSSELDLLTIDGWQVISRIGPHERIKKGDLVLFLEVDAFLPSMNKYGMTFSQVGNPATLNGNHGFRVGTQTYINGQRRKVISQGHAFSLDCFDLDLCFEAMMTIQFCKDQDEAKMALREKNFSAKLGIKRWETESKAQSSWKLPQFMIKTDMDRVQNCPNLFIKPKYKHAVFQETVKMDGSTMTCYFVPTTSRYFAKLNQTTNPNARFSNGRFGVCSRNVDIQGVEKSAFWGTALDAKLHQLLPKLGRGIALQGELVGWKVQGNPHGYPRGKTEFFLFAIIDIEKGSRWNPKSVEKFAQEHEIKHVQVIGYHKLPAIAKCHKDLMDRAEARPGEGLVFKNCGDGRWFKVLSRPYIVNHGDEVRAKAHNAATKNGSARIMKKGSTQQASNKVPANHTAAQSGSKSTPAAVPLPKQVLPTVDGKKTAQLKDVPISDATDTWPTSPATARYNVWGEPLEAATAANEKRFAAENSAREEELAKKKKLKEPKTEGEEWRTLHMMARGDDGRPALIYTYKDDPNAGFGHTKPSMMTRLGGTTPKHVVLDPDIFSEDGAPDLNFIQANVPVNETSEDENKPSKSEASEGSTLINGGPKGSAVINQPTKYENETPTGSASAGSGLKGSAPINLAPTNKGSALKNAEPGASTTTQVTATTTQVRTVTAKAPTRDMSTQTEAQDFATQANTQTAVRDFAAEASSSATSAKHTTVLNKMLQDWDDVILKVDRLVSQGWDILDAEKKAYDDYIKMALSRRKSLQRMREYSRTGIMPPFDRKDGWLMFNRNGQWDENAWKAFVKRETYVPPVEEEVVAPQTAPRRSSVIRRRVDIDAVSTACTVGSGCGSDTETESVVNESVMDTESVAGNELTMDTESVLDNESVVDTETESVIMVDASTDTHDDDAFSVVAESVASYGIESEISCASYRSFSTGWDSVSVSSYTTNPYVRSGGAGDDPEDSEDPAGSPGETDVEYYYSDDDSVIGYATDPYAWMGDAAEDLEPIPDFFRYGTYRFSREHMDAEHTKAEDDKKNAAETAGGKTMTNAVADMWAWVNHEA